MDGSAAIEKNREALKRILALLVAMAGLAGLSSPLAGEDGSARRGKAEALAEPGEGCFSGARPTLPRHLHRAILRLLRPAESAARRLVIAAACGLVVALPAPRKPRPQHANHEAKLRRFGIAVVLSPADIAASATARKAVVVRRIRKPCLPLFDPLPRLPGQPRSRRTVPAFAAPRILLPGIVEPHSLPPPPSPRDPVGARPLYRRIAALGAALDDLPGQARRFARWKARRAAAAGAQNKKHDDARGQTGSSPRRFRRISPLRPGRPPGGRLSRYDPSARRPGKIRDVDEVLAHAHALAIFALAAPDTS